MSDSALAVLASAAQFGSIIVKPKRAIGPFTAQVTIRETHHDELVMTDHPVEKGSTITDHAYKLPVAVTIECGWSNSPSNASVLSAASGIVTGTVSGVGALLTGNSQQQVKDIYSKLVTLQTSRVLMDVYTGKRLYKNMLIRSLRVVTDKHNEESLNVVFDLREIIIAGTTTILVSAPIAQQKNAPATAPVTNQGTKSLAPGTAYQGRGSINPTLP